MEMAPKGAVFVYEENGITRHRTFFFPLPLWERVPKAGEGRLDSR